MNYSRRSTKICHLLVWVMSFFIWWVLFNPLAVAAVPDLPAVVGEAAIVIDAETGNVLGSKNPDLKLPIASTTKIMTALLALENGHLADRVTLSEEAALQEGSSMYTSPGESYTLEELLYGLMLNSGNDAAWALAEHIAASVPDFVAQMNTRAQELGAVNTHFTNPSGLPDPDHYSTARDLALIAKAAMAREDFRRIVATKAQNVPWPVKETDKLLVNHNKLLWRYEGADGIKTGYTNQARQCLVASATRDGQRLIAVVLKSEGENVWSDAQRLLDWGFTNFSTTLLVRSGEQFGTIPVKRGEIDKIVAIADRDLKATLPKESVDLVQAVVQELPASLTAPVDKGQILGKVVFTVNGEKIGEVPLVAAEDVPRPPKRWWFWLGLLLLLWLIGALTVWDVRRRRRRMRLKRVALRYRGPK